MILIKFVRDICLSMKIVAIFVFLITLQCNS